MTRVLFGLAAVVVLAGGCQVVPRGSVRHAAERPHPRGVLASSPPADSSYSPLRCWRDGSETICNRSD